MIGCTVNASSRSGARGSRTRLRSARISVSVTSRLTSRTCSVSDDAPSSSAAWPVSVRNTSSSVGRRTHEVIDIDAGLPPSRRTASTMLPLRETAAGSRTTWSSALGGSSSAIGASARTAASTSAAGSSVTSSRSPPTWRLSSSEVPFAITRPWSITAISSASRSASSRYWVVRSTVRPSRTSSSITSHNDRRLRGSSPVVGSSRNRTGGRATSASARSSRRRIPPEYPLTGRLAASRRSKRSSSSLPRAFAVGPAHPVQPADHRQVLKPGQVLVDRRVLPGEADLGAELRGVVDDVEPGDLRRARVGLAAASSGCERRSSCPRRSGRAARAPTRATRRDRRRRAPAHHRRPCAAHAY